MAHLLCIMNEVRHAVGGIKGAIKPAGEEAMRRLAVACPDTLTEEHGLV